ncbi:ubiquitin carboxyl-terminal hydrolase 37-like, partial [Paramuricea clavata]
MAASLHRTLCEVKGEVKLQATNTISRVVKQQPGKLRLSQLGDSFYIQCVYDNGVKPSKKYKLDRKQVAEAQLIARDGKLTVYLTGGCARFHLEKGIENEIETFICCLDEIKRTVLTKAAVKYEISNISPIPRVDTLFGSKEAAIKPPTLVLRRQGASRTPQKTNASKEQSKLMSQTPNKAPEQVLKLTAQHENRQQTPDKIPRETFSQHQVKAVQKLIAQQGNRQQTPDGTPRENLSQNQAKALQKLTAQQGNRQQTPNKIPRENLSQNQAKPVQKLAAQQGDREQTPDKTSLRNTSFHEGKSQCRKSLGDNSQQTLNKTPTSIPKLCSHPRNQQKQRMNGQKEDDLEKENINIFFGTPEKQRPSENQSDSQSSTFGTPRKKTPLQENETSPQLSRSTNVKVFYGNNSNNSIRVKRIPKRPLRNASSSSPSQTPRYSLFSTTPTATRNIQTQNKASSGDQHNVKQSTLFAYLADNEVTSQGFTNLGNTCYMNAILQSILGLVPFVQELDNNDLLNTVGRLSLYNCMYNLFRWKNDDGSSTRKKNALKRLKNSLNGSEMTKRFSGYLQNDAHEFMNICLDQMKEEVQEALGEKSEDIAAKVCPVVRNFEGSLRKYIKCKGCKDVVTKDELFNHLSLNIPHNQS